MRDWISKCLGSGSAIDRHSLMWESFTLMLNRIRTFRATTDLSSIHGNEKRRLYSKRVLDIEHGTFTPLVFTTTGGMGKKCLIYHSRLAQLIQGRGAVCQNYLMDQNPNLRSFPLLRSGLVCRRGSRASRVPWDIKNVDMLKEPFNRTIDVFPHFLIFLNCFFL